MAETIEAGPNLSFTIDNVSHGVRLTIRERNAELNWVLHPNTVSRLVEALNDALVIGSLKQRGR